MIYKDKAFSHANDDAPSYDTTLDYGQRWEIEKAARQEQSEVFAMLVGRAAAKIGTLLKLALLDPIANFARRSGESGMLERLSNHQLADIGLNRFGLTGQVYCTADLGGMATSQTVKHATGSVPASVTAASSHDLAA